MPIYRVGVATYAIQTMQGSSSGGAADTANAMFGADFGPRGSVAVLDQPDSQIFGGLAAAVGGDPVFGAAGAQLEGSGSTMNVDVPDGVVTDSIVVVTAFVDGTAVTVSAMPSGFTQAPDSPVVVNLGNSGQHRMYVMWKRATGADSTAGTYDFTLSGSTFRNAQAIRYDNALNTGDPWDVTASAESGNTNVSASPAVSDTTLTDNSLVIWAATSWAGPASPGWTAPAGFTKRRDITDAHVSVADKLQVTAGPTGSISGTCTASDKMGAWIGALKPVGGVAGPTNLIVANAAQAHTAQNVVLTQEHNLVVANAAQAQTAQNATLVPIIPLVVQNAAQAHTATSPTLTQVHVLAVGKATQGQTAQNAVLTQLHVLVVAKASQAQSANNIGLIQQHLLAANKATQAQTAQNIALTQVHVLVVQKATQGHTAQNVTLSSELILSPAKATQAQTAQNVVLTQVHNLSVGKATQAQSAQNVVLAPTLNLVVAKSTQTQTAQNVVLTQAHALVVQNAAQAQTARHVTLLLGLPNVPARVRVAGTWVDVEVVGLVRIDGAWVPFGVGGSPWVAAGSGRIKTRVAGSWVDSDLLIEEE